MNSTSGTTCILIQTDGLISIRYRNKLNEDAEADIYLPDAPELDSECVESDTETFTMKFKGFIMEILFKKVRTFSFDIFVFCEITFLNSEHKT